MVELAENKTGTALRIPRGFKQTELGLIPEDWEIYPLNQIANFQNGKAHEQFIDEHGDYIVVNSKFISTEGEVKKYSNQNILPLKKGDITIVMSDIPNGKALAKCFLIDSDDKYTLNQRIGGITANTEVDNNYLCYKLNRNKYFLAFDSGTGQTNIKRQEILDCPVALPPTKAEQTAIATALSDMDALIAAQEQLIAKKRAIKQGAMQELLKPKEGWEVKTLEEITDCLDNLRVPLNQEQRSKMKGDIPYCGANGIVDYVNDYVIDDKIILIAEDGGYFDEYLTRPIAYQMEGKCWVNNHAHILKAKKGQDQDFIFYSLVHKNILSFLASGTRAKLNKAQMYRIEIYVPATEAEQTSIACILSDMDTEIDQLENQLAKNRQVKVGMMQELLTGKKRLIEAN
jgi:type I restriction enzyme S subunit